MASTAKLNFLSAATHLLPAKEDYFLNILLQLDQLLSLAFKNAMHDAFDLCHYWHRLCHRLLSPLPSFLYLGYWFWCWHRFPADFQNLKVCFWSCTVLGDASVIVSGNEQPIGNRLFCLDHSAVGWHRLISAINQSWLREGLPEFNRDKPS